MKNDSLEERVALFLERRDREPELTPESFASRWPLEEAALLEAIRATLQVKALFPAATEDPPRRVARYELHGELGRGGMGIVYEARLGEERYAVKLLRPWFLRGSKSSERFLRECNTLKRLSHPHIVRLRDHGIAGEHAYLVMELVEGRTLVEIAPHLTREEASFLVERLARAVHAAHELGILHRDLKPQNVMLREDGSPVLLDFGLVADDLEPSITSTDELLGTPRYMAPEQARGERASVRTDVHGLGMLLYELCVGRPVRTEDTRALVLRRAVEGHVVKPRRLVPEHPPALERIILKALAFEPRDRYESAAALADDLARFRSGDAVRARLVRPWTRAWRHVQSHPSRAATTLALSIGIALVTWSLTRSEDEAGDVRAQVERHLDRAVAAHARNHRKEARAEIRRAEALDEGSSEIRTVKELIDGSAPMEPVLAGWRNDAEQSSHRLALEALRLRLASDQEARESFLRSALERHPDSLALSCEYAEWLADTGGHEEAVEWFRRCIELHPGALHPRERLALFWKERDRLDLAVETALRIHEAGMAPVLQPLFDRLGDRDRVLEVLGQVVQEHPERLAGHKAFGYASDSAHRIEAALHHYEVGLRLAPRDPDLLVWLANLRAGGDRTSCAACERAFAQAPSVLDPGRAEELLVELARVDRGRSARFTASLLYVASKLPSTRDLRRELAHLIEEDGLGSEQAESLAHLLRNLESRLVPSDRK